MIVCGSVIGAVMQSITGSAPPPRAKPPSDDERWAKLYEEVPSAFWLDPNLWGDAPTAPPPPTSPPPPPPRLHNPAHSWLLGSTWEGIPIVAADFAYHDMTYRLRLENGQAVVVPEELVREHRRRLR